MKHKPLTISEIETLAKACIFPDMVQRLDKYFNEIVDGFFNRLQEGEKSGVQYVGYQNEELSQFFGAAVALGRFEDARKIFEKIIEFTKMDDVKSVSTETIINTPLKPYFL